jgi:8-oxo-dGTP pyrophosphatase MutT (NUDIX family)
VVSPRAVGGGSAALTALARRLQSRSPRPAPAAPGVPRAAVAVVLREAPAGLELLLIKRADRRDDPWSGHVALPGGREEAADGSLEATAVRETLEETGIDLTRDGVVLGALDDLLPRAGPVPVLVRPYVAVLRAETPLVISDEVAAAFWVPIAALAAPDATIESVVRVREETRRVPSFRHGDYIVWGLTERIVRQLLSELAASHFS